MSSVSLNGAEQKLVGALNFSPSCSHTGMLGKVHKFGHEWIVSRENYGGALISGITGLVHCVASALFHSLWSMTAGKLFIDKEPRELAGRCWKEVGKHILVIVKSVAGVALPSLGKWLDSKVFALVPKVEKPSVEEEAPISVEGKDQVDQEPPPVTD